MPKNEVPPVASLVRALLGLRTKSGRDLAILGASWIDLILEKNLTVNMDSMRAGALTSSERRELFEGRGVLASTSAKFNTAHAFGLISRQTLQQGLLLNTVRNAFAHTIEDIDSGSPMIAKLIDRMELTADDGLTFLKNRPDASTRSSPFSNFRFDGEDFDSKSATGVFDVNPDRVLFFVPCVTGASNDDVLRNHIYACAVGAAGLGLKSWMLETAPAEGIADRA